jgi:hypothetical protein
VAHLPFGQRIEHPQQHAAGRRRIRAIKRQHVHVGLPHFDGLTTPKGNERRTAT